ncbi:carboxy-S-adenosyl-L-methionine synthase CmoA [Desulfopila inferna]|uniref:carboxy-S-adenosyl-L-methionine synthase CmoA n=1 Tax=Desulfopila inferna TaxID=468528 RepID=UPI001F06CB5D|nr:carboxy-S-adenosyl-L-methionine synthase CmoA [Desulfopila inferna]
MAPKTSNAVDRAILKSEFIPVRGAFRDTIINNKLMTDKPKDTLFQVDSVQEDFIFSERVVEVFDDMLDRSIPFYHEVIQATANLLQRLLRDDDRIVDLGCATGTTLLEFCRLIANDSIRYLGVDNSPAMLDKGRLKAELYSKKKKIEFLDQDIMNISLPDTGVFILNYTLQFIRPVLRQEFLQRVFDNLRPGGVLILGEKTIRHDPLLNRIFIDLYHQYKRQKGYSELEIAKKREALENVLIPFSIEENKTILKKVGFQSIESYFQWFNFVSFVAIKPTGAIS